ncbi:MAG: CHAD domain-containing protein [Gemmataceae bacterium]
MAESHPQAGKWLHGLKADLSVQQAGPRLLEGRTQQVLQWLQRLEQHPSDDEAVHQLRVSVRRTEAAMWLLRPCLKRKLYRHARDTLRVLRRAVSSARDADVLMADVQKRLELASDTTQPGLDLILGFLLSRRLHLQLQPLPLSASQFAEQAEAWQAALTRSKSQAFGPLAQKALREALRRLDNSLTTNLSDGAALHAVRIAAKRLRYVLEIVGPSLDPRLIEDIYPQVEMLQELLGQVNDAHTAIGWLTMLRSSLKCLGQARRRYRAGLDSLIRSKQRQIAQHREPFQNWLTHWQNQSPPSLN